MTDAPIPSHAPDLFSKVGPLPAWAWGALVVGGFMVYQHMHASTPASVDNPTEPFTGSDSPTDDGTGVPTFDPSSSGYNYQDVLSGNYTGTTATEGTSYSTNQQWGVSVISNMVKMGYSAGTVTTAVTLYLSGQKLTAEQANIITLSITNFGPPPLPLPLNSVLAATPVPAAKPTFAQLQASRQAHRVRMRTARGF